MSKFSLASEKRSRIIDFRERDQGRRASFSLQRERALPLQMTRDSVVVGGILRRSVMRLTPDDNSKWDAESWPLFSRLDSIKTPQITAENSALTTARNAEIRLERQQKTREKIFFSLSRVQGSFLFASVHTEKFMFHPQNALHTHTHTDKCGRACLRDRAYSRHRLSGSFFCALFASSLVSVQSGFSLSALF